MLEFRISIMKSVLDSLRLKESTGRDIETVGRKDADAKSDANNLADGLRQDTFVLYAGFKHNVVRSLFSVDRGQRKLTDSEGKELHRGVHNVLHDAVVGVQLSLQMFLKLWTEASS